MSNSNRLSSGHGVPPYSKDEFKLIIFYAQQHNGQIHHAKATELMLNDSIKSHRILDDACKKGLMHEPPPPVGFVNTVYTYYYTLTDDGYKFQ